MPFISTGNMAPCGVAAATTVKIMELAGKVDKKMITLESINDQLISYGKNNHHTPQ
jgi:hypothetical protein